MAKAPRTLLAESLTRAKQCAEKGIIQAKDLTYIDRNRLKTAGWLTRVIRGWYLLTTPTARVGESTAWYGSYWNFVAVYLHKRFGTAYCLSASASLGLHLGKSIIPQQLLVLVKSGGSTLIKLPHNTSLLTYQETNAFPDKVITVNGVNVMPLALALYRIPPKLYVQQPDDAEIALRMIDQTTLTREALSGTNTASAERIIGAYEFLREKDRADALREALTLAGYRIQPTNPFDITRPLFSEKPRLPSPYALRIQAMWLKMRDDILSIFPDEPGMRKSSKKYFSQLEKIYVNDAYNSLSIEGYDVSEELIKKIAIGKWNPNSSEQDRNQINAMAAKGYRMAFEAVKRSIERIFAHHTPGKVIKSDLPIWYGSLFSPSVKAGLLKAEHLAGYRSHQVYIRGSMHTPLPQHALMDAMDAYFACLTEEKSAAVRALLGHFIFVFIHPYMDGNGRIARFIMNILLASGGFPWTIVRVKNRDNYFKALEIASVKQNIKPFAKFILEEMKHSS